MKRLVQTGLLAAVLAAAATASAEPEGERASGHGFGFGFEQAVAPVESAPGLCGGLVVGWSFYLPVVTLMPRVAVCVAEEEVYNADAELYVGHSWGPGQVLELDLTFDLGVVGGVSLIGADEASVGLHGGPELGTTIDLPDPWTLGIHLAVLAWAPTETLTPWTLRTLIEFGYRF